MDYKPPSSHVSRLTAHVSYCFFLLRYTICPAPSEKCAGRTSPSNTCHWIRSSLTNSNKLFKFMLPVLSFIEKSNQEGDWAKLNWQEATGFRSLPYTR